MCDEITYARRGCHIIQLSVIASSKYNKNKWSLKYKWSQIRFIEYVRYLSYMHDVNKLLENKYNWLVYNYIYDDYSSNGNRVPTVAKPLCH